MLAARTAKLRSQRDINLWRIQLELSLGAIALFAITLVPDILDARGTIHIPSWLTMGSIDDARAILSAMMGAVATVLALIVLRFRPGQFLLRGEPLASVLPAAAAQWLEAAIDRNVAIGRHRTLTQDSEFAIAQIVEIAKDLDAAYARARAASPD